MQAMSTFYYIGVLASILGSTALMIFALSYAREVKAKVDYNKSIHSIELGKREAGAQLAGSAHWFSESKPAQIVIGVIAESLMERGSFQADTARDRWREEMKRVGL